MIESQYVSCHVQVFVYRWMRWSPSTFHVMFRCLFTLQVDVIESQYGGLLDTINSTRDFEAVKLAHEHFLAALLAQSFVHMKSVSTLPWSMVNGPW